MHHLRRPRPPSLSRGFLTWNWDCQRTSSSHVHAVDTISCGCSDQFAILPAGCGTMSASRKQQMAPAAASHHARTYLCLHGWKFASQPEKIWHWYVPWRVARSYPLHIGAHWVKVESPSKYIKIIMLTNIAAEVDEVQYPVPNSHILRTVSRKTAPITSPKSGPSAWRTT